MLPEEQQILEESLRQIAKLYHKYTPKENLKDFEGIELSIRNIILENIGPQFASFFFEAEAGTTAGRDRKVKTVIGEVKITEKQADKLGLEANKRISPVLEKCCLRLVGNESFEHAEKDIEIMTGIKVPKSTQHRLVGKAKIEEPQAEKITETMSIDGGKVRIRTPLGQPSEWKEYKSVSLHGQVCAAFFQENEKLVKWVNKQILAEVIVCLGDGHDGIWNLFKQIGEKEQRMEILDWFHLMENLYKIGGSNQVLREIRSYLWQGEIDLTMEKLQDSKKREVINFCAYVNKHRERIPNYEQYQKLGITIGSGSVESTVKQIGVRMKIVGAQWKAENVPQYLRLRCAYLNGKLA